jgi:hypothetical protein
LAASFPVLECWCENRRCLDAPLGGRSKALLRPYACPVHIDEHLVVAYKDTTRPRSSHFSRRFPTWHMSCCGLSTAIIVKLNDCRCWRCFASEGACVDEPG